MTRHARLVTVVCAPPHVQNTSSWPGGCPCVDRRWCEPIHTARPAKDVLAAGSDGYGTQHDELGSKKLGAQHFFSDL